MYVSCNSKNIITAVSSTRFRVEGETVTEVKGYDGDWTEIVGQMVHRGKIVSKPVAKPTHLLRVAVVCNWNDRCGISTYSKFLIEMLRGKVAELHVFSEVASQPTSEDEPFVTRCWRRGDNLRPAIKQMLDWKPDFIIVQHEFGIFPNACHFFQLLQSIDHVPHVVVMHSVYEHLDKAVYTSAVKNIVVHSEEGRNVLRRTGNTSNVFVLPHGCHLFPDVSELWNIMQNPYTVLQFGFGFRYKGVERILEAVSLLKHRDAKFANIFYCFLLSTNGHNARVHEEYYENLMSKVSELDIEDNVVVIRKYNSDEILNLYLRLFKAAVFPYVNNPNNTVYGASGAARLAMANGIPVICSESHLFDDLEGVAPRPDSAEALARQIDDIFSRGEYRQELLRRQKEYVERTSWSHVADMYLAVYPQVL